MQLYLLALFYAAILIYAFALDPKARVMFVPLTASSLALALLMWRLSVNGRTMLVWACTTAFAIMGLSLLFVHQRTDVIERPAATWIREFPGQIEMDSNTRKHLALVPESRTLPGLDSNRPYFLHLSPKHCALWIVKSRLPHGSIELVREQASSSVELVSASLSGSLCLFRYRRPMDVDVIQKAVRRARADLRYMFREH